MAQSGEKTRTMILIKGERAMNIVEIPSCDASEAAEYKIAQAREGICAVEVPEAEVGAIRFQVEENAEDDDQKYDAYDVKDFEKKLFEVARLRGDNLTAAQVCRSLRQVAEAIEKAANP